MSLIKLLRRNKEREPKTYEAVYNSLVEEKIRKKYSVSDELAILRQKEKNPTQFEEYDAYAEQCKADAKEYLNSEDGGV